MLLRGIFVEQQTRSNEHEAKKAVLEKRYSQKIYEYMCETQLGATLASQTQTNAAYSIDNRVVCVLAKRNKDSKLIWSERSSPQPPAVTISSPSPTTTDSKDLTSIRIPDHREDHQWSIGECIRY
jgi:hypothetical protein